jgi:hypothetical protein
MMPRMIFQKGFNRTLPLNSQIVAKRIPCPASMCYPRDHSAPKQIDILCYPPSDNSLANVSRQRKLVSTLTGEQRQANRAKQFGSC